MGEHDVELADAIEALRAGLYEAMRRGWQANMRFRPSPVEVTLQAQLTRNAEGKLGWGVVAIGGKAEAVTVQTLKLTLTPEWRDGDRLTTDFTISTELDAAPSFTPRPDS